MPSSEVTKRFLRQRRFSVSSQPWPGLLWKSSCPVISSQADCSSGDIGAPLEEELLQQRAMAANGILAIAADREVGAVRKRGEDVERLPRLGPLHLRAIAPREAPPVRIRLRAATELHGRLARRECREPGVVPITRRELRFRHAARRAPDGAEARTFADRARSPEPDDADRHV